MPKAQMPPFQIYFNIARPFSWEGFTHLNVLEALSEIGFSKTEGKRLLSSGSIKIRDTRITEDGKHFEWYRRTAGAMELVEPNDIFYIGKRVLTILQIPFSIWEKLYYSIRDWIEKSLK